MTIPEPTAGSMAFYLWQMFNELKAAGSYRVKWEWAINEAMQAEKERDELRAKLAAITCPVCELIGA